MWMFYYDDLLIQKYLTMTKKVSYTRPNAKHSGQNLPFLFFIQITKKE